MTVGEVVRAIDAYEAMRRDRAYFAYTNAMTVGLFISAMFNSGRKPPTMQEIYPELFQGDDVEEQEQKQTTDASVANFMKLANAINERFQNGNGKPESENNG